MEKFLSNVIEYKITENIRNLASAKANEDIKNAKNLKSRFQTNELDNKILGNIGEIIFQQFLEEHSISYSMHNVTGRPDLYDFKLPNKASLRPKFKRWDVKTCNLTDPIEKLTDGFKFLILQDQLMQHPSDYYFLILVHRNTAYLGGFISYSNIFEYPKKENSRTGNLNREIPLDHLAPPTGVINLSTEREY